MLLSQAIDYTVEACENEYVTVLPSIFFNSVGVKGSPDNYHRHGGNAFSLDANRSEPA